MITFGLVLISFFIGAIPTGLWMGRLKGVDVRSEGSGNVGATNVTRVAGKLPGLLVLIIDAAKGWFPAAVLVSWAVPENSIGLPIGFGAAAVMGHVWNPFLRFKGGKGVATALGVLLALDSRVALGSAAIFMGVFIGCRYVSVASMAAAMAAPFLFVLLGLPTAWTIGSVGISILIFARHRSNIFRLLHGEENRAGKSP